MIWPQFVGHTAEVWWLSAALGSAISSTRHLKY
jgi:hypothetical protein